MRSLLASLAAMLLAAFLTLNLGGCDSAGDDVVDPGDDTNDDDAADESCIFSSNYWHDGGGYSPVGTPVWNVCGEGSPSLVDIVVGNSNPTLGVIVPLDSDEIRFVGQASGVLELPHLEQITNAFFDGGRPGALGDVVVFPSLVGSMTAGDPYRFFLINVQGTIEETPPGRSGDPPPRTRVVALAFGNGEGGYVASPPNTDDTFAGALVWMKATRNPYTGIWSMSQLDWRSGTAAAYGTSLRLLLRGDAAIAIIREAELQALGATKFRWDTFSYTTDPSTDWSHDFTDWVAIP